jgi:hypothetical protein
MTKSSRKRTSKRHADNTPTSTHTPSTASEQLRTAFDELKESTAHFLETALTEAQRSALILIEELRSRATGWLSLIKQTTRISRPRPSTDNGSHAGNPALS